MQFTEYSIVEFPQPTVCPEATIDSLEETGAPFLMVCEMPGDTATTMTLPSIEHLFVNENSLDDLLGSQVSASFTEAIYECNLPNLQVVGEMLRQLSSYVALEA